MTPWAVVGGAASLATFVLLGLLLWDCARRTRFRPIHKGAIRISSRGVRRVWLVLLVGGFVAGLHGRPLVSRTASFRPVLGEPVSTGRADPGNTAGAEPEVRPTGAPVARVTGTLRLPFYVRTVVEERSGSGDAVGRAVTETLQIPVAFFLVSLFYGIGWLRRTGKDDG